MLQGVAFYQSNDSLRSLDLVLQDCIILVRNFHRRRDLNSGSPKPIADQLTI